MLKEITRRYYLSAPRDGLSIITVTVDMDHADRARFNRFLPKGRQRPLLTCSIVSSHQQPISSSHTWRGNDLNDLIEHITLQFPHVVPTFWPDNLADLVPLFPEEFQVTVRRPEDGDWFPPFFGDVEELEDFNATGPEPKGY